MSLRLDALRAANLSRFFHVATVLNLHDPKNERQKQRQHEKQDCEDDMIHKVVPNPAASDEAENDDDCHNCGPPDQP